MLLHTLGNAIYSSNVILHKRIPFAVMLLVLNFPCTHINTSNLSKYYITFVHNWKISVTDSSFPDPIYFSMIYIVKPLLHCINNHVALLLRIYIHAVNYILQSADHIHLTRHSLYISQGPCNSEIMLWVRTPLRVELRDLI